MGCGGNEVFTLVITFSVALITYKCNRLCQCPSQARLPISSSSVSANGFKPIVNIPLDRLKTTPKKRQILSLYILI
ncbi:hypothetical protein CsSME_00000952 [Camellia sinensis var. sinensis]